MLDEEDYVKEIESIIDNILSNNEYLEMQKWELIKLQARGFSIKYAARKKKSRQNKIQVLEKKLQRLERELINEDIHSNSKIFNHKQNKDETEAIR